MGRTYIYECVRCGYRTKAAGKEDRGLEFMVQTVVCSDCKEVYDAVVRARMPHSPARILANRTSRDSASRQSPLLAGVRPGARAKKSRTAPRFEAMINRLPVRGVRRYRWVRFEPACPVSAFHRVAPWNEPGRCPRCGVYLERSALPFKIWD